MRVSGLTELCGCAANSSGSLLACHDVSAVMSLVMKSHVLFSNEIGGYSPLSKKHKIVAVPYLFYQLQPPLVYKPCQHHAESYVFNRTGILLEDSSIHWHI